MQQLSNQSTEPAEILDSGSDHMSDSDKPNFEKLISNIGRNSNIIPIHPPCPKGTAAKVISNPQDQILPAFSPEKKIPVKLAFSEDTIDSIVDKYFTNIPTFPEQFSEDQISDFLLKKANVADECKKCLHLAIKAEKKTKELEAKKNIISRFCNQAGATINAFQPVCAEFAKYVESHTPLDSEINSIMAVNALCNNAMEFLNNPEFISY